MTCSKPLVKVCRDSTFSLIRTIFVDPFIDDLIIVEINSPKIILSDSKTMKLYHCPSVINVVNLSKPLHNRFNLLGVMNNDPTRGTLIRIISCLSSYIVSKYSWLVQN